MNDNDEAAFILGIKIYRDRTKRLIGLSPSAYMDKILKRFKMDNSKRGNIPMQERFDLNKTQGASKPEKLRWPPRVTLGRLLPHARGLGFKPRRGGFPSGAKKEWGLFPKANVRVLHTAQLDVTLFGYISVFGLDRISLNLGVRVFGFDISFCLEIMERRNNKIGHY
nr:hypothetical protein [Tanacetum cinerariifolium]